MPTTTRASISDSAPDPKMRWWFDHHPTAFQPPALREVFDRAHLADVVLRSRRAVVRRLHAAPRSRRAGIGSRRRTSPTLSRGPTRSTPRGSHRRRGRRARQPAQRLAAWLAPRPLAADTARYVELARRRVARRARRAARARVAARGGRAGARREMRGVKKLGDWHGDVMVVRSVRRYRRAQPRLPRLPAVPGVLYTVVGTRTQTSIKITVGAEPVDDRSRAPRSTSARCARSTAAAVTPRSAASRCAPTSCARARRDRAARRRPRRVVTLPRVAPAAAAAVLAGHRGPAGELVRAAGDVLVTRGRRVVASS